MKRNFERERRYARALRKVYVRTIAADRDEREHAAYMRAINRRAKALAKRDAAMRGRIIGLSGE